MTQKDKELLLKDLLGRVLYGVKVDYHTNIFTLGYNLYLNNSDVAFENYPMPYFLENIESVKPYLRPMSSMTEEEKKEISELIDAPIEIDSDGDIIYLGGYSIIPCSDYQIYIDYLISHHFDYYGLITMGLALEAPEDMYKEK